MVEHLAPEAEQWLRECAQGVEIEKQMPDGTTVVGRFGADPGKAVNLLLQASEFFFPKLARVERTLESATDEEIWAEMERRLKPQSLNGGTHPALPAPEVKQ